MFNGSLWTKKVRDLIFSGDLDGASKMVYKDFSEFPEGERTRVQRMRKLLKEVKGLENEEVPEGYIPVALEHDNRKPLSLNYIPQNFFNLTFGYFSTGTARRRDSTFDRDFAAIPQIDRVKLQAARFGTWLSSGIASEFRVLEMAYICGSDTRINAYGFSGCKFVSTASSRMAKVTSKNNRKKKRKLVPRALLLPIPHGPENYYHVMSEMIYGLRYADATEDCPIVYQADRFNLLPEFCRRLKIDPCRLTPFEEVDDVQFCKAVLPSAPTYFWNKAVTDFFSRVAGNPREGWRRVYISRRRSSRGPANEMQVEEALRYIGFEIVYPEEMSINAQIDLFSQARVVVSIHGAGITNTAFMPEGGAVMEMFSNGMLVRDFYMRTRHKELDYSCLFYDQTVPVDELLNRLKKLEIE